MVGCSHADTRTAMPPEHEELGHVPNVIVVRDPASAVNQREASEMIVDSQQEWEPPGVAPVSVQPRVGETAVVADFRVDDLAEIVRVELEQFPQHWLVGTRRPNDMGLHPAMLIAQGWTLGPVFMAKTRRGFQAT